MPFPDLAAAGFNTPEDSQFFQDTPINGALSYTSDGGLIIVRKKFTRSPGRTIVTGFSEMTSAQKQILDAAYFNNAGAGSVPIAYIHPLTGEALRVLISESPPYTSAYKGWGADMIWEISALTLRTV